MSCQNDTEDVKIKYIKQFSLLQKDEDDEKEFSKNLSTTHSRITEDHLKEFKECEEIALSCVNDAKTLLTNKATLDLGWLVVRRNLLLCQNKKLARISLNRLILTLEAQQWQ